jgi:hypothetical protein
MVAAMNRLRIRRYIAKEWLESQVLCHFARVPVLGWFVPKLVKARMNLPNVMEQQLNLARQELMRRLAADPTLLQRLKEARKADAQLRPWKH